MLTIAFTGGGTGGHIYPGLAVIEYLQKNLCAQDLRLLWVGSNSGMDRSIIESAALEFYGIPAGKLRRYFSLKTLPDIFRVIGGFFSARRILRKHAVDLLFSKGGFVSVAPCAAAASLGIPVFTHESDFSPGLATRLNLRFVRRSNGKIFTAYEETGRLMPEKVQKQIIVSGNPVRAAFRSADPEKGRAFLGLNAQERILLILGGSQGAQEVNNLIRACLADLCRYYTVVHQYGPEQCWDLPKTEKYIPLAYIKEAMPHVCAAAELIVGRSGAGTVWESAVLGKPMILVPLCGSGTRGDQVENARFFERENAALVLFGRDPDAAEKLSQMVSSVADDPGRRRSMAEASLRIGALDGAAIIGNAINEFIKGRN